MSLVTRKQVFGVFDQVKLKPVCSAKEVSYSYEIVNIETRDIILSRQWTIKALIRLLGSTGWSASLLFAYGINRFSQDVAHQPGHPPSLIRVFACVLRISKDLRFLRADSEDLDQTGRMPRLIWVFAGRACHFVGFVMWRLKYWWKGHQTRTINNVGFTGIFMLLFVL